MKLCFCATLLGHGQLGHFWGHILRFREKNKKNMWEIRSLCFILKSATDFIEKEGGKEGPKILF